MVNESIKYQQKQSLQELLLIANPFFLRAAREHEKGAKRGKYGKNVNIFWLKEYNANLKEYGSLAEKMLTEFAFL